MDFAPITGHCRASSFSMIDDACSGVVSSSRPNSRTPMGVLALHLTHGFLVRSQFIVIGPTWGLPTGLLLRSAQSLATRQQRKHQRPAQAVFPQGNQLSQVSQDQLDAIALRLNQRPRKTLDFETPADSLRNVLR